MNEIIEKNGGDGDDISEEFESERLSTPEKKEIKYVKLAKDLDEWSENHRKRTVKQTQGERHRMFHKCMEPFSSIVIQPEGAALQRSCKLDIPMFTVRDKPVKE